MNKAWRMALAAAAVGMVAAVVAAQRDSSRITKEQASTMNSLTIVRKCPKIGNSLKLSMIRKD